MIVDKSKLLFNILFNFKYKRTGFLKQWFDCLDTENKVLVSVTASFICTHVYLNIYEGEHDFIFFYVLKYRQNNFSCSEHGEILSPASFGLWQHRSLHQQLYVDRQLLDCYCCKLANSAIICATWNLIKSLIFWWTVWEWRSDPALHVWHFVLASQQHLLRVHPLKGSFAGAVAVWPNFPCSCCFPVCSPMRNPLKPLN